MARINTWNPENQAFWVAEGKKHAQRNLWISVPSLMIAFIIWQIWSVVAIKLNVIGFAFPQEQLFTLAALPGLVGATLRFVYTFGSGAFGDATGRFLQLPSCWFQLLALALLFRIPILHIG